MVHARSHDKYPLYGLNNINYRIWWANIFPVITHTCFNKYKECLVERKFGCCCYGFCLTNRINIILESWHINCVRLYCQFTSGWRYPLTMMESGHRTYVWCAFIGVMIDSWRVCECGRVSKLLSNSIRCVNRAILNGIYSKSIIDSQIDFHLIVMPWSCCGFFSSCTKKIWLENKNDGCTDLWASSNNFITAV